MRRESILTRYVSHSHTFLSLYFLSFSCLFSTKTSSPTLSLLSPFNSHNCISVSLSLSLSWWTVMVLFVCTWASNGMREKVRERMTGQGEEGGGWKRLERYIIILTRKWDRLRLKDKDNRVRYTWMYTHTFESMDREGKNKSRSKRINTSSQGKWSEA